MHGCDFDVALCISDLEVGLVNVFDTSRAFKELMRADPQEKAANLTSFEYLCQRLLGVQPDK